MRSALKLNSIPAKNMRTHPVRTVILMLLVMAQAACVMGGTSMAGGVASIGGTILGVFVIALLQEGILALGATKDYQLIITGIIVIVAVYTDIMARRRKN